MKHLHVCMACGKTFYGREVAKTCSAKCRKKLERERKGDTDEQRARADARHKDATSRPVSQIATSAAPSATTSATTSATKSRVTDKSKRRSAAPSAADVSESDIKKRLDDLSHRLANLRRQYGRHKSANLDLADEMLGYGYERLYNDAAAAARYADIADDAMTQLITARQPNAKWHVTDEPQDTSAPVLHVTDEPTSAALATSATSAPPRVTDEAQAAPRVTDEPRVYLCPDGIPSTFSADELDAMSDDERRAVLEGEAVGRLYEKPMPSTRRAHWYLLVIKRNRNRHLESYWKGIYVKNVWDEALREIRRENYDEARVKIKAALGMQRELSAQDAAVLARNPRVLVTDEEGRAVLQEDATSAPPRVTDEAQAAEVQEATTSAPPRVTDEAQAAEVQEDATSAPPRVTDEAQAAPRVTDEIARAMTPAQIKAALTGNRPKRLATSATSAPPRVTDEPQVAPVTDEQRRADELLARARKALADDRKYRPHNTFAQRAAQKQIALASDMPPRLKADHARAALEELGIIIQEGAPQVDSAPPVTSAPPRVTDKEGRADEPFACSAEEARARRIVADLDNRLVAWGEVCWVEEIERIVDRAYEAFEAARAQAARNLWDRAWPLAYDGMQALDYAERTLIQRLVSREPVLETDSAPPRVIDEAQAAEVQEDVSAPVLHVTDEAQAAEVQEDATSAPPRVTDEAQAAEVQEDAIDNERIRLIRGLVDRAAALAMHQRHQRIISKCYARLDRATRATSKEERLKWLWRVNFLLAAHCRRVAARERARP